MKRSHQDSYYLEKEGNDFFRRNILNKSHDGLRPNKQVIYDHLKEAHIEYDTVLEYGCNIADLLHQIKTEGLATRCCGVEASDEAIAFARENFNADLELHHGTIADNPINVSAADTFDLILVDDVFGWVSRETIMQSATNIDAVLADGGYLFIRDFYPDKRTKNVNHHVASGDVFNFKVPGSHANIFLATGMYEVHWQKIYYDSVGMSTGYKCDNPFNYRWTDVVLKKSHSDFFNESRKV